MTGRLGLVAALLVLSLATQAQADNGRELNAAQWRQLHEAVCAGKVEPNKDGGWVCTQARDYPTSAKCPLSFGPAPKRVFFGRFSEAAQQAIAFYDTVCEPHANNYGGMALFRVEAGRFVLERYFPGTVMDQCVVVRGATHDLPYCRSSYMGQGVLSQAFGPLHIVPQKDAHLERWFDAENADGFYGMVEVPCADRAFHAHHLSDLRLDGDDAVVLEAAYLAPSVHDDACRRVPAGPPQPPATCDCDVIPSPPEGSVLLEESEARFLKARIRFRPPAAAPAIEMTSEMASPQE